MSKLTILVNLGTPDQPYEKEVRKYLKEFLSDKYVIRFIMWITNGPTDITGTFEFTDWQKVDDFASKF